MRFTERLRGLKKWTYETLCKGREMKTPAPNMDITQIQTAEPKVYLAWTPSRLDKSGTLQTQAEPSSVCPSILIMPVQSYAAYMEEKRFDRYNNVHRPHLMGQHMGVQMLFTIYEPGVRLPGFAQSAGKSGRGIDPTLMLDATEQGLFTLLNWMDDAMEALLGQKMIPNTDLFVEEDTMTYSLYTDQSYVVDRRPIYYGFVNVSFGCFASQGMEPAIEEYLR